MPTNRNDTTEETIEYPSESPTECPTCDGTGIIYPLPLGCFNPSVVISCPDCDGTGAVYR